MLLGFGKSTAKLIKQLIKSPASPTTLQALTTLNCLQFSCCNLLLHTSVFSSRKENASYPASSGSLLTIHSSRQTYSGIISFTKISD